MFAVIKTGGKQYKVAKDDVITVEKLAAASGDTVEIGDVLMIGGSGEPTMGTPRIEGAKVMAEVVEQTRGDKIIVFKKRRRQNYRRKRGHRQDLTVLKIKDIFGAGGKPVAAKSAAKSAPKAEAKTEANAEPKTEAKKAAKPAAKKKSAAKKSASKD